MMNVSLHKPLLTVLSAILVTGSAVFAANHESESSSQPERKAHHSMMGAAGGMGQMGMGGAGGMMGMGMQGHSGAADAPWISLSLQHAEALGLSGEQVRRLEVLRADYDKQAIRDVAEMRIANLELSELLAAEPVEMAKVETQLRRAEALRTGLRLARIRAIEQGKAVLTESQRDQLKQRITEMARGSAEDKMGGAGMKQMHEFMQSESMPKAMAGMMAMAERMGGGDPMAGMVRMMEMMGDMGNMGNMGGMGGMMGAPDQPR